MFEKHYTPAQLHQLKARREALGEEAIRQVEAEWPQLIARVRAEMDQGTDPTSEPVRSLAMRWRELLKAFTGGDPGIEGALNATHQQEPEVASKHGLDPSLFAYIGKAMASLEQQA
ncbi:TipAS antibiotic-recognition domain-containing protein [Myxococcus xanthus]|uniref:TipAS antibiotic-recognition domain-containing protein n=1 Tax=Myxococcus xanthus TaxID=34 RepID=A0A7Y4MR73_MYXXA|nr:TipAS antibiotic-recognition domain-containing protein [Myxococcus xanthus]NOJ79170.1 TipAS antibiotic-recognition domain-containing protein [Myxococcus xanthus]NOJ85576.1 TipAS antibiotic-recognition domain-containing protein [Myxococcus xanthus]